MRYYIIAGEASGDLHASNLMKALKQKDSDADFRGLGGDLMKAEGASLLKHIKELAFMGFAEVAANIRTILSNIKRCKTDIIEYNPDCIILVDYPGFNLRIAEFAKEKGYKLVYYIAPQVWAWKAKRTELMRKYLDLTLAILPFEKKFLEDRGVRTNFVGHPLLDAINTEEILDQERKYLALMPGSRGQEIKRMLPVMLSASEGLERRIAKAPSQNANQYLGAKESELWSNGTYELLKQSKLALVTSGTATLETALFDVPQAVCYKTSPISYQIGKALVKVPYISLVNLICDKEIVPEFIQSECNQRNLEEQLEKMQSSDYQQTMKTGYQELREKLGGPGASDRAAKAILEIL